MVALAIVLLMSLGAGLVSAKKEDKPFKPTCVTLQDQILEYSAGHYLEGGATLVTMNLGITTKHICSEWLRMRTCT